MSNRKWKSDIIDCMPHFSEATSSSSSAIRCTQSLFLCSIDFEHFMFDARRVLLRMIVNVSGVDCMAFKFLNSNLVRKVRFTLAIYLWLNRLIQADTVASFKFTRNILLLPLSFTWPLYALRSHSSSVQIITLKNIKPGSEWLARKPIRT